MEYANYEWIAQEKNEKYGMDENDACVVCFPQKKIG